MSNPSRSVESNHAQQTTGPQHLVGSRTSRRYDLPVNCRSPVLGVILVFAALGAPPAHGRCRMANVAALPIAINADQLLTRGAIDGKPVSVLIDTGSYMSLIWRS